MVPTQPSVPEDTTQDPVAAAPLGLTRAVGTRKPPPLNLKTLLPDVGPGSFLIKLRRLDPFYCKNPGPSSTNTPLVTVAANHSENAKSPLSLVKNHCALLMKRAKHYTSGITRSPTGVMKQRRFQSNTSNKRKHSETMTTGPEVDQTSNNPTNSETHSQLQVVTSFALRTLLLEDVWFLEEGSAVVLFFHTDSLPPRYSKKWLEVADDTQQSHCMPTVQCQGRQYQQLTGWVHKNGAKKQFDGPQTYEQIIAALQEFPQNGIHIKFPMLSEGETLSLTSPPDDCTLKLLTWFELFQFPQSIFLQSDYHPERNWLATFKSMKDNGDDRATLLHRLVQETPGDRFMLAELKGVWDRCDLKQTKEILREAHLREIKAVRDEMAAAPPPPFIEPDVIKPFCEFVDKHLLQRLEDCFGRFTNIFDKFISESELRTLANEFERQLPDHFKTLMGLSGYTQRLEILDSPNTKTKPGHAQMLRLRYSLDVFFQFVNRARKYNNHRMVPFGLIFALAQYACGHPLLATQIPVWMGWSVSKRTMERRIEPFIHSYDNNIKRAIRRCTSLLCVFDNLQDGRKLQFQSGQSSVFTRVTARFIMTMYLSNFPDWVYTFQQRPALTFIQQSIPSPYNMPTFELEPPESTMYTILSSVCHGTFQTDTNPNGNPFDCSGKRVRYYQELRSCCRELDIVRRYLSTKRKIGHMAIDYTLQPTEFAKNPIRHAVAKAMHKLRKNRNANLFALAKQFPSKVVQTWRAEPPVAELLILPVSVLDETTKTGASGIVIDFMVLHGLLEWDDSTQMYQPREGWDEKWLFIVGDGLSLERIFQFLDDIMGILDSKLVSFRHAYRQAMNIAQVVHRLVPINGDLHVRFHMLDVVYRLFYGGFLQVMQWRLQWKRLDPYDVSNSYRLCHRLAVVVYEEVQRIMLDLYLLKKMTMSRFDEMMHFGGAEAVAVYIAKDYLDYLNRQVRESKDWLLRFLCNFLLLMRKYLTFLEAEQQGDSVTMEAVIVEYLPFWFITKKKVSFNNQLRLIELYYNRLPISVLQQIRINRTKRQKPGSTPSMYIKESALDQIMERLMPFFKGMSHNGTEEAFVKVSKMLTACQRAKHFVEFYTRQRSDAEYELSERDMEEGGASQSPLVDPGQRNKKTTSPSSRLNRVLVTEILTLAKCHKVQPEKPSTMDEDCFWRALDETSLEVHKKVSRLGDGKVDNDATDKYVMVQVNKMMSGLSKRRAVSNENGEEPSNPEMNNDDTDDNDANDDDSTVVDIAEKMKDIDDDGSTVFDDVSYFSDNEPPVVTIESDPVLYGTQPETVMEKVSTVGEDDEEDADGNSTTNETEDEELAETQIEDVVLAAADEMVGDEAQDDGEDDNDEEIERDETDEKKAEKKDDRPKPVMKGKVKGMKVASMNPIASVDILARALHDMAEKNVVNARQRDSDRKEREQHFLRLNLYNRLQAMEEDAVGMDWGQDDVLMEEDAEKEKQLDEALALFAQFKEGVEE